MSLINGYGMNSLFTTIDIDNVYSLIEDFEKYVLKTVYTDLPITKTYFTFDNIKDDCNNMTQDQFNQFINDVLNYKYVFVNNIYNKSRLFQNEIIKIINSTNKNMDLDYHFEQIIQTQNSMYLLSILYILLSLKNKDYLTEMMSNINYFDYSLVDPDLTAQEIITNTNKSVEFIQKLLTYSFKHNKFGIIKTILFFKSFASSSKVNNKINVIYTELARLLIMYRNNNLITNFNYTTNISRLLIFFDKLFLNVFRNINLAYNEDEYFNIIINNNYVFIAKFFNEINPRYMFQFSKNNKTIIGGKLLSTEDISDLELKNLFNIKTQSDFIKNDCCICLQEFSNVTKSECSHYICAQCYIHWYKDHITCPLCRTEINHNNTIFGSVNLNLNKNIKENNNSILNNVFKIIPLVKSNISKYVLSYMPIKITFSQITATLPLNNKIKIFTKRDYIFTFFTPILFVSLLYYGNTNIINLMFKKIGQVAYQNPKYYGLFLKFSVLKTPLKIYSLYKLKNMYINTIIYSYYKYFDYNFKNKIRQLINIFNSEL